MAPPRHRKQQKLFAAGSSVIIESHFVLDTDSLRVCGCIIMLFPDEKIRFLLKFSLFLFSTPRFFFLKFAYFLSTI